MCVCLLGWGGGGEGGDGPVDPNPYFLGSAAGKTKPNRWVERSPKMRN